MNKAELVANIATKAGVTKADAARVIDALPEVFASALNTSGEVMLPGVGKLVKAATAARQGRNPKTGEAMTIAAGVTAKLRVSSSLKDALK